MLKKSKDYIHVRIGEIKFNKKESILNATLGSCVGIAIIDKVNQKCGLAHCFLPEGKEKSPGEQPAKYVVDAVEYMFNKMKLHDRPVKEYDVYIAGGGNMMAQLKQKNVDHIGHLNKKKALELLAEKGVTVKEMLNGNCFACKIFIDCDTMKVKMIRIKGKKNGSTTN